MTLMMSIILTYKVMKKKNSYCGYDVTYSNNEFTYSRMMTVMTVMTVKRQ